MQVLVSVGSCKSENPGWTKHSDRLLKVMNGIKKLEPVIKVG